MGVNQDCWLLEYPWQLEKNMDYGPWTMDRGLSMDYGPWTKDWSVGALEKNKNWSVGVLASGS